MTLRPFDFSRHLLAEGVGKILRGHIPALRCAAAALAALCFGTAASTFGAERTQEFELAAGWNAIFLDVDPTSDAVEASFDSALVDVVARYFVPTTPVRYIEDAAEEPWNMPGWSVWYAAERAESFLNTLHAVHGGAAYLVHAVKAGKLAIAGEPAIRNAGWKIDSFNLTGFPVDVPGLTFAQYFAGAENRLGTRVYRLNGGSWQKITNLAATQIRPGEAYWVYCEGRTDYPGPLEVRTAGSSGIHLNERTAVATVELRNRINAAFGLAVSIEANDGLPLYRQEVNLSELTAESKLLSGATSLGSLAPGQAHTLRLELRREFLTNSGSSAILKISTDNGVVVRVPVHYRPQ